jgi:hypothetical protein
VQEAGYYDLSVAFGPIWKETLQFSVEGSQFRDDAVSVGAMLVKEGLPRTRVVSERSILDLFSGKQSADSGKEDAT